MKGLAVLHSSSPLTRRTLPLIVLIAGTLAVIILAGAFSGDVATRVLRRRVSLSAPSTIRPGEPVTLRWSPVSAANRRRYPQERISLHYNRGFFSGVYTLARQTPNDGRELVRIPRDLPAGVRAFFRITAYSRTGRLLSAIRTDSRPAAVAPRMPSPPLRAVQSRRPVTPLASARPTPTPRGTPSYAATGGLYGAFGSWDDDVLGGSTDLSDRYNPDGEAEIFDDTPHLCGPQQLECE